MRNLYVFKQFPFKLFLLSGLAILLVGCSGVQTKEIGDDTYQLVNFYSEPPRDFDSFTIESEADELCPLGYLVLTKNAGKAAEFGYNDFSCAAGQNCDYVLEWRIHCEERAKPDFSVFGKT